jgi:hypothetical protein
VTIERKSCAAQIKRVSAGQATVVIATLGVRDKDGDVIMPGFFGEQVVQVAPAHDWHAVPIGKARVYEESSEALADITFNLKTAGGKDWHEAILFDFEHPPAKQEYSFGFRILEGGSEHGSHAGEQVRFLRPLRDGRPGLDMVEVSPVMRGAGQHTRTLAVKEWDIDGLKQDGFEIQTLIFPKGKWDDAEAVRAWCRSHDFASDLDETDSSWRARQRDPGDFTRLRTICINPSQDASPEDCRVSAVGGPVKEAAGAAEPDVKRYTVEQLLSLLDSQLTHLTFVQDMRTAKGKLLNAETIEMIDATSQRFDILRAKVKLGQIDRQSINEELEVRYAKVSATLAHDEEVERAQEAAANESLLRSAQSRLERIEALLHR